MSGQNKEPIDLSTVKIIVLERKRILIIILSVCILAAFLSILLLPANQTIGLPKILYWLWGISVLGVGILLGIVAGLGYVLAVYSCQASKENSKKDS